MGKCRFIILFLFTFVSALKAEAQESMHYFFRHINESDGLLHNEVFSITQDGKGFIWVASSNGLQRYDGARFVYYPDMLSNSSEEPNYRADLFVDTDKKLLWVMKNGKLEKMEFGKNKFSMYDWESVQKDKLNDTKKYTDSKHGKWFLNGHNVYHFDELTKKLIIVPLNISNSKYHRSSPGDVLNNTQSIVLSNVVYVFDEKNDSVYSKEYNPHHHPLLEYPFPFTKDGETIRFILIDNKQHIWVTTWGNYFYQYENDTKMLHRFSLSAIKAKEKGSRAGNEGLLINCLMEDDQGNIWIGTESAGLLKFNAQSHNFDFCIPNELDKTSIQYNFRINSLFEDNEKNIWVGTDRGINIFSPYRQYFRTIHYQPGELSIKSNEILSAHQVPGGDLFIGTGGGGVSVYDSDFHFKKNISFKGPWEINVIWSIIQPDKETLWFGCQHGYLIVYDLITGRSIQFLIPEAKKVTIICMEKDSKGNIFMGLNDGNIIKWNRSQNKFFGYTDSVQNRARVNNLLIDKEDNIWVTTNLGFKKFDAEMMRYSKVWLPDKSNPGSFSGLTSQGMEELDDSTLLIGTSYGGLNFFNKKSETFLHRSKEDGMPSNNVYAIKKDTAGYVWATSDYEIYKFIPGSKKFIPYEIQPGIVNSSFASNRFLPLKDGQWMTFSTTELVSFFPYEIENNKKGLGPIEITGFSLFNNPLNIDSVLFESKPLRLTYTQNFFTIEFASLGYSNLNQINYYYRLSGVDKDWVNGGSKRFASYTGLRPGKYFFEIKGDNGMDVSKITSLEIIISPPFWQTWWFITIIALLLSSLAFILIRWRIKNLREIDKQKLKVQRLNADHYKSELELEQIVNYFSFSLIEKNTVNDVLSDVAQNLIGHLGFMDCVIYLWNDDNTKMVKRASVGSENAAAILEKQNFDIIPGQGVVGFVIQSKEPVLISDTSVDPRCITDDIFNGSEIGVPVIYNSELIGIIDSKHTEKNFFTRRHLQILNTIATLMATKIRSIEAEQSLLHTQIKMYSINDQLSNAKLEALRSQMNPHFIFNCLNSIDALIHGNDKYNATTYLNKFAKLLRNILDSSRQNTVTLSKDVETLKLYIELEVLRHENKFKTVFNIDEKLLSNDYKVPPLIVQPFVENAILHGLKNKEGDDGILTVDIIQVDNKIKYTITDNGIGRKAAGKISHNKESHYGLQITSERIRLFNKEEVAKLHIADLYNNDIPEGTSVTIILNIA